MHQLGKLVSSVACAVLALGASSANAAYPEKPITMIIAYSAGGGTDTAARAMVPFLEKYLGEGAQITVVNKPGASGEIGFTETAQAKPDGYTVGWINLPSMTAPLFDGDPRYDADSFTPLGNVVYDPGAFSVSVDSDIENLDDLAAYAKEHPGATTVGISSIGGDDHIGILRFGEMTDTTYTVVPFHGSAPIRTAIMGGHIVAGAYNVGEGAQFQDKIRLLGQQAEERSQLAPDVPTFKEQGYEMINGSSRGIAGPAGMPQEAIDAWAKAIEQAVNDPKFQEASLKQGVPISYLGPQEYADFIAKDIEEMGRIWETNPWK